jgi:hypothetical protein
MNEHELLIYHKRLLSVFEEFSEGDKKFKMLKMRIQRLTNPTCKEPGNDMFQQDLIN